MSIKRIHISKIGKVSDKWESYLSFYDAIFSHLKNKPVSLLEIGVQNGGSLETWAQYFTKAKSIVGIDINPKCQNLRFKDPRIKVVIGDATTIKLTGKYDIIIDDGSHKSTDMIEQFKRLFPRLKTGGMYVVEDFHAMWMQGYGNEAIRFFSDMVVAVNAEFCGAALTNIKAIEFRNSLVLIRKGRSLLGKRMITGNTAEVEPSPFTRCERRVLQECLP
jgi:hypothetical protein